MTEKKKEVENQNEETTQENKEVTAKETPKKTPEEKFLVKQNPYLVAGFQASTDKEYKGKALEKAFKEFEEA